MCESNTLEFKRELSRTYLKTVSAFANYGTGSIMFGIDDDGTVVGLEDTRDTCLRIEHAINDSLSPIPKYELEIDDGQSTVTLIVHEGPFKPYLCSGKAYRRFDTSTVEVDRPELSRLILAGMNTTFDACISNRQTLSFSRLEQELSRKTGIEGLDRNALISLELISPTGEYNNAAALLADSNGFPGLDIVRFGESINIIHSRFTFEKTSILNQIEDAMAVFDEHYSFEEIIGVSRMERTLIPREAFREAIANALVHRRWDIGAQVKVNMFPDRIDVVSPGGLPAGLDKEDYLNGGPSVTRNPILANVLFRLGYIERFGTGIPRIKHEYSTKTVSPSFAIRSSSITVTLPADGSVTLSVDESIVIDAIPKGLELSASEIAQTSRMTKAKTLRIINSLIEKRLVTRTGTGRATRYVR